MIILVDMDGVIVDFERGLFEEFKRRFPTEQAIPLEERKTFYARDQYPERFKSALESIYTSKGFYQTLQEINGGVTALREMAQMWQVYLCTTPLTKYENCVLEKYLWTEQHLGREWVKRIILTNDKTVIRGDKLIDDNPEIKGIITPSWEHLIYDQPYNRQVTSKRRINWTNWRAVLNI
jgi:5'-nucleotidase